jgi:hypothetical protein
MDRGTMVHEEAIDKLTDEGVRSILSRSIRGLSSDALASARHRPTCGSRTHDCDSISQENLLLLSKEISL